MHVFRNIHKPWKFLYIYIYISWIFWLIRLLCTSRQLFKLSHGTLFPFKFHILSQHLLNKNSLRREQSGQSETKRRLRPRQKTMQVMQHVRWSAKNFCCRSWQSPHEPKVLSKHLLPVWGNVQARVFYNIFHSFPSSVMNKYTLIFFCWATCVYLSGAGVIFLCKSLQRSRNYLLKILFIIKKLLSSVYK